MLTSRFKNTFKIFQILKNSTYGFSTTSNIPDEKPVEENQEKPTKKPTPRLDELQKKLRAKTPIGKLDEFEEGKHPYQEKEPLKKWPHNKNPTTGEIGGPAGPEPTRYGDWERKGRVSDF